VTDLLAGIAIGFLLYLFIDMRVCRMYGDKSCLVHRLMRRGMSGDDLTQNPYPGPERSEKGG